MERAFKCDLCSEKFISQSKLNHHMGREHGKLGYSAKKNYKCNVCGKECRDKTDLTVHMRVHTGERPFKCTVGDCETEFKTKSDLNTHMKFKHSEERPFECNLPGCKYNAKSLNNLRQHMKKHSDDRPFACPNEGCSFRAKHKHHLTRHLTTVHSTAKAFPCSACEYKATRKGDLKILIRRRHSTGTLDSPCTREDNSKCSHSEYAEHLVCSPDLESLLNNLDEASSSQCDQSGCERSFDDTNALCDLTRDPNLEQSDAHPNLNSTKYSTKLAENSHTSGAENRENVEPNDTHKS